MTGAPRARSHRTGAPNDRRSRTVGDPVSAGSARPAPARARFRALDRYRVEREWKRYEGTAQRDLFRQLRERFLLRHADRGGWALDVGPGPGRFSPFIGSDPSRRVLVDLSETVLRTVRHGWARRRIGGPPHLILGDAGDPPFRPASFDVIAALGNVVGFAGARGEPIVRALAGCVRPGGTILFETVAGGGEVAAYLHRLPPTSLPRLLRAPVEALVPRIAREGFHPVRTEDRPRPGFLRLPTGRIADLVRPLGFEIEESLAVAPVLGEDPVRVAWVAQDPVAWEHLLRLEERYGSLDGRKAAAAALLVAARRRP